MPDRDLLDYCLENLRRHSPAALRRTLLSEGLDAVEVDDALLEALARRAERRARGAFAGFLFALLAVVAAALWVSQSRLQREAQKPPERLIPRYADSYAGKPGWLVRLPAELRVVEVGYDPGTRIEVVYLVPDSFGDERLRDREAFLDEGGVELQVGWNGPLQRPLDLDGLRDAVRLTAKELDFPFGLEEASMLPLPAFRLRLIGDKVTIRTILLGRSYHYIFATRYEDQAYRDVISGLTDAPAVAEAAPAPLAPVPPAPKPGPASKPGGKRRSPPAPRRAR